MLVSSVLPTLGPLGGPLEFRLGCGATGDVFEVGRPREAAGTQWFTSLPIRIATQPRNMWLEVGILSARIMMI